MIELRFRYRGTGLSLLGLTVTSGLLTVFTLGLYAFWARNNIRKFHYRHTDLDGEAFKYHGRGGELLRGWLIALGIMIGLVVVLALMMIVSGRETTETNPDFALLALIYGGMGVLMTLAVNAARRYRLSRSSWRGIRFSFKGEPMTFLVLMITGVVATIITLGFYGPTFANQRRAFLVNNARYGSERFYYDGDSRELFKQYVRSLLLTIPTLGLCWIWYAAFKHRLFWQHTTFAGLRFHSTVRGDELFKLHVTNLLLSLVTVGIGTPWVITRSKAYFLDNLTANGTVDLAQIQERFQNERVNSMSEGLAEALDVDVGLGV